MGYAHLWCYREFAPGRVTLPAGRGSAEPTIDYGGMMSTANTPVGIQAARIIFWGALTFTLVMATLPHPPQVIEASDKVEHALAFLVLTALHKIAYRGFGFWPRLLVMAFLGGAIEIAQMIPQLHRDAEWMDWAADVAAAFVASVAVVVLVPRRRGP